jgi:hypothetical protein
MALFIVLLLRRAGFAHLLVSLVGLETSTDVEIYVRNESSAAFKESVLSGALAVIGVGVVLANRFAGATDASWAKAGAPEALLVAFNVLASLTAVVLFLVVVWWAASQSSAGAFWLVALDFLEAAASAVAAWFLVSRSDCLVAASAISTSIAAIVVWAGYGFVELDFYAASLAGGILLAGLLLRALAARHEQFGTTTQAAFLVGVAPSILDLEHHPTALKLFYLFAVSTLALGCFMLSRDIRGVVLEAMAPVATSLMEAVSPAMAPAKWGVALAAGVVLVASTGLLASGARKDRTTNTNH